ncbi:MAG: hypothetical protein KTR25_05790 [Myxococcales bacterium]|nr:hypothetical protein [Myxococcales bacterium]
MRRKSQSHHLVIDDSENCVTLRVDDWELFDFIEDHLTAHDLEQEHHTEEQVGGVRWYVLHFCSSVDPARLKKVLDLLDPEEIERIWLINN